MRFSVITCTYNASAVVERTLESVSRQTYDDVEHIIIDGASTDDTTDKVRSYASSSHRHKVVVVSEPDRGLYDAMNKGLRHASGDYLVFLNAGDRFYDDSTLESLNALIGEKEYGVVYGNTMIVDEQGNEKGLRRLQPPERLTWRSFSDGMLVCHQSFYANTAIAKHITYDLQYRYSADVDWCIRIMKEAEKAGLPLLNSHMTLCSYLEGGMSVQNHRASLLERFQIMRRHYGLLTTVRKHLTFLFR